MLRKSKSIYDEKMIAQSREGFFTTPSDSTVELHRRYFNAIVDAVESADFTELMAMAQEAGRYQFGVGLGLAESLQRTVSATNMIEIALLEANEGDVPQLEIIGEVAELRSMIVMAVAEGYREAQAGADKKPASPPNERLRAALTRNRHKYRSVSLKPGEEIGPLYDAGMRCYVVEHGKVRLYNLLPNGRTITLSILSEGDVFLQWKADEVSLSCLCAEAMQQSSVISVSEDELIELVASQPASAVDVIGNISRRLTESQVLIEDLMNNSVDLRLYRTLQELARQFGRRDAVGGAVVIDIPLTHQRLADMIGSNRVTVSRKLHVLQERGVVGSRGVGTVVILDLPKLDQLAVNTGE